MKRLKIPKIEKFPTGWSYSAWGMFQCMYKYYHIRILGMKDTPGPQMERGISQHKIAEQYLKGNIRQLPDSFDSIKVEYRNLKQANPIVEQFWGVDKKWKPVKWQSWAVMKMDAAVAPSRITDNMLFIQDYKTGREYPSHIEQGELYGCIGVSLFPKAEAVEAEFWYGDQGYCMSHTFDRAAIRYATQKWTERGKEMLSPRKKWPTTPTSDNCKFCFLRADRGGPCEDFVD